MCYDKNSDKYDKSTEPFFVTYSNFRHVECKKRLLVYCDLMADLTVFQPNLKKALISLFSTLDAHTNSALKGIQILDKVVKTL